MKTKLSLSIITLFSVTTIYAGELKPVLKCNFQTKTLKSGKIKTEKIISKKEIQKDLIKLNDYYYSDVIQHKNESISVVVESNYAADTGEQSIVISGMVLGRKINKSGADNLHIDIKSKTKNAIISCDQELMIAPFPQKQ